ncbi:hypothetical protein cand_026180 [Cryptosporidium andersoni]|uniref:Transmembrane protein n=1 Tax=Cryptosporidium andersoni TaxID=117008 RepID=A0A1J4MAF4_9CRYT|nr:hypothetical protein cand_026180 [Cryptosporidium andersoni]
MSLKASKFINKIKRPWINIIRGPSIFHSVLFGFLSGIIFYGVGFYGYRFIHVTLFDTENLAIQSKRRYMEKQQLFYNKLEDYLNSQYLLSLAKEYNPVSLSAPFNDINQELIL